jgi:hypothetical protein
MVSQFRVQGFRSLRDVTLDLKPLNVLVGRNDSGKTNVLDALEAWSRLATAGARAVWPDSERSTADLWGGGPEGNISFSVVAGEARHDGSFVLRRGWSPRRASEMVTGRWGSATWTGSNRVDWKRSDGDAFQTNSTEPSDNPLLVHIANPDPSSRRDDLPFGELLPGASGWAKYALRPDRLRARGVPTAHGPEIEPDGQGLAAALDHLYREDRARFARIEKALVEFAPGIRQIIPREDVGPETGGSAVVWKKLAFALADPPCTIEAEHVSEGVLLVLAWLTIANLPHTGAVVLIDEPENGVHPQALRMVMGLLRKLSRGEIEGVPARQVVITTHSPFVVDCLKLDDTDELFVLERGRDGATTAIPVSHKPWIHKLVPPYLLGEAWVNFGEQGLTADTRPAEPVS